MANAGAKLSSFPEVNDIQTGDMFPLLSDGNTNAKIDYATLARTIIAKLKSEDVVQTQTNSASKLISAALAYSMNQDILQLEDAVAEYRLMIDPDTGCMALAHYNKEA